MLKRTALLSACLAITAPVLAHSASRGEAKVTLTGKTVAIEYGRPSLEGRDMLGKAEAGKPWRMGADAPTTLKTDVDLAFGSTVVPKGNYVLTATKVSDGQWTLNVRKPGGESASVAEVPLVSGTLSSSVETFTIELRGDKSNGEFEMKWGTVSLKSPFSVK